jgi:hypothetical protein
MVDFVIEQSFDMAKAQDGILMKGIFQFLFPI